MKIEKRILVAGQEFPLISEEVRLELTRPGRAQFRVQSSAPLAGVVEFFCGWGDSAPTRYFVGTVERCNAVNEQEQLLFCREYSALLEQPVPLGLRHVNLAQVVREIGQQTGLDFVTPSAAYCQTSSPYYFHTGDGYSALDALGTVFRVPDFIWQQQSDSRIYVGGWADSPGAQKRVQLNDDELTGHLACGGANLPMNPHLRPGTLTSRGTIQAIGLTQALMSIQWKV